ncbi:MAG: hypothetical protein ACI8PB_004275 [Desulforhopalus sp.]|jgi:hypothetical protein
MLEHFLYKPIWSDQLTFHMNTVLIWPEIAGTCGSNSDYPQGGKTNRGDTWNNGRGAGRCVLAVKNTPRDERTSMSAPVGPYLYHPNFYLYSRHILTSTIIQAVTNHPQWW